MPHFCLHISVFEIIKIYVTTLSCAKSVFQLGGRTGNPHVHFFLFFNDSLSGFQQLAVHVE